MDARVKPAHDGLLLRRAPGLDIQRIKRMATRHKEAVLLRPAKRQIGAALGKADEADRLAEGVEDPDADEVFGLGGGRAIAAPPAPQIAIGVALESVERPRPAGV